MALCCDPCDKAHWVEQAAAAGKHVFLNKPFCESLESARRIEAAVERHGVQLVHDIVAVRFEPGDGEAAQEVRDGRYGEASAPCPQLRHDLLARLPARRHSGPSASTRRAKSGGGELTNLGCYAVDYMVALWGLPRRSRPSG